MVGMGRRLLAATMSVVIVGALIGGPAAHASTRLEGATVNVYYGPTCKKQFGSTNCGSAAASGDRIAVATYPAMKRLAIATSKTTMGIASFNRTLPFSLAFVFSGRTHGHSYQGGWRMTNLQGLSGQMLPLDLLHCPSGAWVATIESVADSCTAHGTGVVGYGAPRHSA
jgi:hypothetical protein